ncbi:pfkB-like carbohydrate kinase family protein [Zea mays]|uniref:Ribokinase n=1 Tax=Zea mays TaxID=4577 RepID=A0A1D6G0Z9_MAIZE|nr:pfkB-like carbohydrate kinase family protein [Zea mays]
MAQARVRLTPAGRTPAATFLSGSNPRPAHLTFFPKLTPTSLSAAAAANAPPPHIVVVGSANADIYVEVDRLPLIGETVAARAGRSLAGGKGANQAACGGRLALGPTYLVARVGDDANGRLLEGALADAGGVRTDRVARAADAPSGHAVVMLMPDGQNSIIIVGGANMEGWAAGIGSEDLELIRKAGVLLLQREIPDWVNAQAAQAAKSAGVPVIMDAGGMDTPLPRELLSLVDIFSPNETELARLTGMPTETFEQISMAAGKCHKMGVQEVLVKLGSQGSALFVEGEEPIRQPIVPATEVIDTTGAGDTFTSAFAVALVEGKPKRECMRFAGCLRYAEFVGSIDCRDAFTCSPNNATVSILADPG